jgi:hypothetical protein
MIHYLYVKTHRKTGLKYLGKTSRTDPYSYTGSGKRWLSHLNKHGYDFDTEILLETTDPIKIIEAGLYYSNIWNVVKDSKWANMKPESGDGGTFVHTATAKKKISELQLGRPSPLKGMTYESIQKDPDRALKRKELHREWMIKNNPYRGKNHSNQTRKKMSESASKRMEISEEERKEKWGKLKGKPWSEARRLAQQNRKK